MGTKNIHYHILEGTSLTEYLNHTLSKKYCTVSIMIRSKMSFKMDKLLYWQCKSPALCKVSSSTIPKTFNEFKISEVPVHVWNDSSYSSQPFFHSLSLINPDIIILEYGHDVSSYMVRNANCCQTCYNTAIMIQSCLFKYKQHF